MTRRATCTEYIGYLRVSTEEQHLGPEVQRRAIEEFSRRQHARVLSFYEDHVSGAAGLAKRPALGAALSNLHRGQALVVMRWDRLARDRTLAGILLAKADAKKARILSADGIGNEDSPEGRFTRGLFCQFSEYERELIAARTKAALAVKKARQERCGQVPYGYGLAADGRTLTPLEAEQDVMETIRRWRRAGLTQRDVVERLNSEGIPARPRNLRGQRQGSGPPGRWHLPMVWRICQRL